MSVLNYETFGGVAYITMNRPDKLNALNDELLFALKDAFLRFDDDNEVRVGVLRGQGRAFCSGADVRELQLRPRDEIVRNGGVQPRGALIRDLLFRFTNWKPILASVHGYALGGGLHLALLCDIVIAEQGCVFQVSETERGSDPSVLWSLISSRSNESFATDVALTGRRWTTDEAHHRGLLSQVAPSGELPAMTTALAESIATLPTDSTQMIVRNRRTLVEAVEVEANGKRNPHLNLSATYRESAETFLTGPDSD